MTAPDRASAAVHPPATAPEVAQVAALAQSAARHWPQITAAPVLFMQRENVVFRVETSLGPHALRLHRPGYHAAARLQSELDLMAMLAGAGMQVPRPVATPQGGFLVSAGDRQASLLAWLPGLPMGRSGQPLAQSGPARTRLFAAIGAQMARMHHLCDAWTTPPGFDRPAWDIDGLLGEAPFWGRFWQCGTAAEQAQLMQVRGRALALLQGARLDYGVIHADLVNENVLVAGPEVHFIDFDDSGFGYRLFDIATTLYKAVDEPDFAALQSALLQGYASQRPLPDLTLLPLFIVLRSLTYLGWIAARIDEPGMPAKATAYLALALRLATKYLP